MSARASSSDVRRADLRRLPGTSRRGVLSVVFACLTVAVPPAEASDDPAGLELADLAAYRAALSRKPADAPIAVTFRDLWDRPKDWLGKYVSFRGRVVRIFRQDAVGEFPSLIEAWMSTPRGDLVCAVYPRAAGEPSGDRIGDSVRFTGMFLKTIRYAAADEPRLAPLLVGETPPVDDPLREEAQAPSTSVPTSTVIDWRVGLGAILLSAGALALAWHHSHKPGPPRRRIHQGRSTIAPPEPPLEFLDAEARPE